MALQNRLNDLPNYVDKRGKLKRHAYKKYRLRGINQIKHIVVHHSLTKTGSAESYARYHVNQKKWPGIGYTFVIDKDGTINQAFSINVRTYHSGNSNTRSLGICCTGDFRHEEMPQAQREALYQLIHLLQEELNLSTSAVKGHSEMPGYSWKACPVISMHQVRKDLDSNVSVPKNPAKPTGNATYHTIQEGDTLWDIANNIDGVTADQLKKYNPKKDITELQVGDRIRLVPNKGEGVNKTPSNPHMPIKGVVTAKQDVWLHKTPDFSTKSRVRVLSPDDGAFRCYGETEGMYNIGNCYVSKKYVTFEPSSSKAQPLPTGVFKQGDKGNKVKQIQQGLNLANFRNQVDGIYGPMTKDAVERFQMVYLPQDVDGIYGPQTKGKLEEVIGEKKQTG